MRTFVCLSLVLLFATTAAAQFGKTAPPRTTGRSNETTQRKLAEKGRAEHPAKVADQANAETDLANALLAVMDTDGDGMVTKAEKGKALAALGKVHKDAKGNMVVPEKSADAAAAAGGDPTQADPAAQGAAAGGRGNEAMARFMQYDTNHDGVLSPNEVPAQGRAMLQGADLNRDGVVDAAELQTYSRHMSEQMRAWAGGVDPKAGGAVPGDGRPRRPQQ